MVYEELLRRMESSFEIMECPERFKVHLATYQFKKEAEFWWGTIEATKKLLTGSRMLS